jgi:phenylacetic acid degradation protein
MAIYQFEGFTPVVHNTAFIHPQATLIGDVIVGAHVYVGPGARIRGDWGRIILEDKVNVQENCIVHMFPGVTVFLHEMAHIGHGAIVHGATIGRNCLVGMNAVIMDESQIGDESIIGALAFVAQGSKIPPRSVVVGNPAKIVKQVTDEMLDWKTQGTELYAALPNQMHNNLIETTPLIAIELNRPNHPTHYAPRKKSQP